MKFPTMLPFDDYSSERAIRRESKKARRYKNERPVSIFAAVSEPEFRRSVT